MNERYQFDLGEVTASEFLQQITDLMDQQGDDCGVFVIRFFDNYKQARLMQLELIQNGTPEQPTKH